MAHRCAGTLPFLNDVLHKFVKFVQWARRWAVRGLAYNCSEEMGFAMVYAIVVRHQRCDDAYVQISGRIVTPHVRTCRIQKLASALFNIKCSMAS
jgi:hypothetical protein